mgnify:CR=1 FL=1
MRPTQDDFIRRRVWICVLSQKGDLIYLGHNCNAAARALEPGTFFGTGWSDDEARMRAQDQVRGQLNLQ